MKDAGFLQSLKHSLWNILAGTSGGITRIRILELLRERPYNVNQLHDKLSMDYKTIQHHIKVLMNERIITTSDKNKYGSMYFISPLLESNMHLFDEILEKTGKKKINREDKYKR
jgi:DNA-binding transcriptional ArsR family regulator